MNVSLIHLHGATINSASAQVYCNSLLRLNSLSAVAPGWSLSSHSFCCVLMSLSSSSSSSLSPSSYSSSLDVVSFHFVTQFLTQHLLAHKEHKLYLLLVSEVFVNKKTLYLQFIIYDLLHT